MPYPPRPFMRFLLPVFLLLLVLPAPAAPAGDGQDDDVRARLQALPPLVRDEVVWLARCIYSESDRTDEQRLVAWVVRNRVETQYRGSTYREVVLSSFQFSAFNAPTTRRAFLLGLDVGAEAPGWAEALAIALDVHQAPPEARPFPITTRHFYSPVSMQPAGRTPDWALGAEPLALAGVDPWRFRFYAEVDTSAAGAGFVAGDAAPTSVAATPTVSRPARRLTSRLRTQVARPARPSVTPPRRQR